MYSLIFLRGRTRLAFSFFLTYNFFFFPWVVIRDTFISCSWRGFFFFFLVPWMLVDIRFVNIYIYIYILTPLHEQNVIQGQFFKQSLTGLNLELFFKELSLPYYLPLGGERIIGFILFPRVLVLCEMQSALSKIQTCFQWWYPLHKCLELLIHINALSRIEINS